MSLQRESSTSVFSMNQKIESTAITIDVQLVSCCELVFESDCELVMNKPLCGHFQDVDRNQTGSSGLSEWNWSGEKLQFEKTASEVCEIKQKHKFWMFFPLFPWWLSAISHLLMCLLHVSWWDMSQIKKTKRTSNCGFCQISYSHPCVCSSKCFW